MIDLHCHSTVSDGMLSPKEVVQLASKNGCKMLALTDHDHTGGLEEAKYEANHMGVKFISGVEISVTWRHKTIHIVGLDFDPFHKALQELLSFVREARLVRLKAISDKLALKGLNGIYEGALNLATNKEMVGRTHIADYLISKGYVSNKKKAFTKYLADGKIGSVKHEWTTLETCVKTVKDAGGFSIIAHPMRYGFSATAKRNLFEEFKLLGGDGIEVHSGSSDQNDRFNYAFLAEKFGLASSVGSDFHRLGDYSGGILGACPELPINSHPIWEKFKN